MSFLKKILKGKATFQDLPKLVSQATANTIQDSRHIVNNQVLGASNWAQPNPILTLHNLDKVSNECCKIVDSCTLLFTQFAGAPRGEQPPAFRASLMESIDQINGFFAELNTNPRLHTLLQQIQTNPMLNSQLDFEDQRLLQTLINDFKREQSEQSSTQESAKMYGETNRIQRSFHQNMRFAKVKVRLCRDELKSIPSKLFQQKYQPLFQGIKDDKQQVEFELVTPQDLQILKYSQFPQVRDQFFKLFSNFCGEANLGNVLDLQKLRLNFAQGVHGRKSYFDYQQEKNLIHIPGDLKEKLAQIRAVVGQAAKDDLKMIHKLTGDSPIRFYDQVYLKEKVKAILLASDPKNIQMLTCFSLQNVLNGLTLLIKEYFGEDIEEVATLIVNAETGEVIRETKGNRTIQPFEIDFIGQPEYQDHVVLFKIAIEDRGTIFLDMFGRPSKFSSQQVSTLTEVGSSLIEGQKPVAYVVDTMDRGATYLSFDQVKTIFHEFGHALNIALSTTKYQYHSCARASVDISEIPSHLTELFLRDYGFVRKFAFQPLHDIQIEDMEDQETSAKKQDQMAANRSQRKPINQDIFNRMIFCDEIFRFMDLEETLFFTEMDVDFNSSGSPMNKQELLDLTEANLSSAFSGDRLEIDNSKFQPPSMTEVENIVHHTVHSTKTSKLWEEVRDVLFGGAPSAAPASSPGINPAMESLYKDNFMLTRFHHLFDYEAGYHSYLVAKVCSEMLYREVNRDRKSGQFELNEKVKDLFSKGGAFDYRNNFV